MALSAGVLAGDDSVARWEPFIKAPPSHGYLVWWRPEKIIPDLELMGRMMKKLEQVDLPQDRHFSPESIFGPKDASSALLFPVLSAGGEKGARILAEFLRFYKDQPRDDRWLLVIAALGRNRSELALEELNAEMGRVKAYLRDHPPKVIRGVEIPEPPLLLPVADARLAWYAGANNLTWDLVEQQVLETEEILAFILRVSGLEWGRLLMHESAFRELIADVLTRMPETDLGAYLEGRGHSHSSPIGALVTFLTARGNWPLVETLVQEGEGSALTQAFLVLTLMTTRINMATCNDGLYELPKPVMEKVVQVRAAPFRLIARGAAILRRCRIKEGDPSWQAFLDHYASKLDPADVDRVEQVIRDRIYAPQTRELRVRVFGSDEAPYADETRPGVYMKGFRGYPVR
jgi:hypothetical protein